MQWIILEKNYCLCEIMCNMKMFCGPKKNKQQSQGKKVLQINDLGNLHNSSKYSIPSFHSTGSKQLRGLKMSMVNPYGSSKKVKIHVYS